MDLKSLILNVGGPIIAPIVKMATEQFLKPLLKTWIENDPEAAKSAVASLYPQIDVHLENWTSKTETEVDDALVDGFKNALEDIADEFDIALANVDED